MKINGVSSHPLQIEQENNLPPIKKEEKGVEGYSTSAKVAMVAGSVIVAGGLFWWCGGPGIAISAISSVSGLVSQQGTSHLQGNPPPVSTSDIDGFPLPHINNLRQQFAINPPQIPSSPFLSSMGVHVSHAPSDIGSALQIGKEICDKIWTPANLADAETAITNWRPGEPINVAFYRPFIEYICQTDPVKKGTLLPKLEQIEEHLFRSSIPGQAQALAKGAIMGKVSQELQKGMSDLYAHVFGRKDVPKTMEETDRRVLSALQGDKYEDVIDVQAFCELVESVFSRHPEEKVFFEGKFRKAVKTIIQNNPEQREFLPAKYRNWVA
jgi:hypothetical protein